MPLLQRNVVIERSGMPQASKRVAGRSEHGAAVRRPPDPFPPITPHPEGVPHLNLRLQARRLRYDERRWRLRRLEGVTVDYRSSSVLQGEYLCKSGAQLGLDPRAKEVRPFNAANRRVQNAIPLRDGQAPVATQRGERTQRDAAGIEACSRSVGARRSRA
jgi:hypothetical protein